MKEDSEFVKHDVKSVPIFTTFPSFERIEKEENRSDTLALYVHYTSITIWQRTNQVRATTSFMAKKLNISELRIRSAKKVLIKLGLIEDIVRKDKTGLITGNYIKVNFIWTDLKNHPNKNAQGGDLLDKYLIQTNSLNALEKTNNLDILREGKIIRKRRELETTNNEELLLAKIKELENQLKEFQPIKQQPVQLDLFPKDELITEKHFDEFYEIYPKHIGIGNAREMWRKLCTLAKLKNIRPEWKVVRHAVITQKESEQWKDKTYIPNPANWIKGEQWNDTIVKPTFKQNTYTKPNNSDSSVRLDRCGIPMPEIDSSTKNKEFIDNIEKNKKYLERFDKLHNIKPNRK